MLAVPDAATAKAIPEQAEKRKQKAESKKMN